MPGGIRFVTQPCANVRGRARLGQKPPGVAVRSQHELQHAMEAAPHNVAVDVHAERAR